MKHCENCGIELKSHQVYSVKVEKRKFDTCKECAQRVIRMFLPPWEDGDPFKKRG